MKHLFTLSLSLLTTVSAMAQQQLTPKQQAAKARHERLVTTLLSPAAGSQKTTAPSERLVAQTYYLEETGQTPFLRDTTRLRYSGTRGSKFDYEQLLFDIFYAPGEAPDFSPDGNPNRLSLAADTIRSWQRDMNNGPSFPLFLKEEHTAAYNSNNKVSTYTTQFTKNTPMDEGVRFLHTYDAQSRLSAVLSLGRTTNQWDTVMRKLISYNAQGRISKDSILEYKNNAWVPFMVNSYTYDNGGNLTMLTQQSWDGSAWMPDARHTMTYNSSKQLTLAVMEFPMGSTTWMPMMKDTFAYAGGSLYTTLRQKYMFDMFMTQTWMPVVSFTRHMNAQGLPDTVYMDQWDANGQQWERFSRSVLTYNTFSNPVWQKTNSYLNGTLNMNATDVQRYYYEPFNTSTGIGQAVVKADVKVYPNPATDHLNISWSTDGKSAVSIRLLNVSGQLLHREELAGREQSTRIGTGHLAPGTYLLHMSNAAGQVLYSGTIVKQ